MTYRSSSSDMDTSDPCPRCGGPLPRVIYGLPTSAAVNEPDSHGIRPVVAGCIVKSVRLECPRCGLTGLWLPRMRTLVPLQGTTTE